MALIVATVEALAGRRPLHQLRPHLSPAAFHQLVLYADSGVYRRIQLGSLRTQMPSPYAVEATLHVQRGPRWLSCVMRLDAGGQSWLCSELLMLVPQESVA